MLIRGPIYRRLRVPQASGVSKSATENVQAEGGDDDVIEIRGSKPTKRPELSGSDSVVRSVAPRDQLERKGGSDARTVRLNEIYDRDDFSEASY